MSCNGCAGRCSEAGLTGRKHMSKATGAPSKRPLKTVSDGNSTVSDRFKEGMSARRLIHGSPHVDKAWQDAEGNSQKLALQELITECVWGQLWNRSALPLKTRSLLTIAFLVSTHREADLKLHIRSAVLRNGCSMDEVREVMLHAVAYCGVVAVTEAFEVADEVEKELPSRSPAPFEGRTRKKE